MRNWKGWPVLLFGFSMFMWGAFLEGYLNNHHPKPQLVVVVLIFTLWSFFMSIKKED